MRVCVCVCTSCDGWDTVLSKVNLPACVQTYTIRYKHKGFLYLGALHYTFMCTNQYTEKKFKCLPLRQKWLCDWAAHRPTFVSVITVVPATLRNYSGKSVFWATALFSMDWAYDQPQRALHQSEPPTSHFKQVSDSDIRRYYVPFERLLAILWKYTIKFWARKKCKWDYIWYLEFLTHSVKMKLWQ